MVKKYDFSIVLACYNGAHFIEKCVDRLVDILSKTRYNYELVFVDDCSKDNTPDVIKRLLKKYPNSQAMYHKKNKGRGGAVEDGMQISRARITGFIDVDLETSADYIVPIVRELERGYDVCTARRYYINPSLASLHRWIGHKGYKIISRLLLKTPLKDTETGCKFFVKEKILPVFDEIKDKGWFWDTEVMVRSYYNCLKIKEFPTIFIRQDDKGSTVSFFQDTMDYITNLLWFRKEIKGLRRRWKKLKRANQADSI